MLAGELIEHLYDFPDHEGEELQCRQETSMKRNDVGYINDSIGLHKMSNPLQNRVSVSLHLYTPPYASMYGCSMYEASSGRNTMLTCPNTTVGKDNWLMRKSLTC